MLQLPKFGQGIRNVLSPINVSMSRDSVRRALGRVPRRARGRHGLRGVWFGDLREFKGGFYQERFPLNSFALTRVRLV